MYDSSLNGSILKGNNERSFYKGKHSSLISKESSSPTNKKV